MSAGQDIWIHLSQKHVVTSCSYQIYNFIFSEVLGESCHLFYPKKHSNAMSPMGDIVLWGNRLNLAWSILILLKVMATKGLQIVEPQETLFSSGSFGRGYNCACLEI